MSRWSATSIVIALLAGLAGAQGDVTSGATLRTWVLDGEFHTIPRLVEGQTPNVDRLVPRIDLAAEDFPEGPTYSRVSGFLEIERAGDHVFRLTSDDGSRLAIDGVVVCDHDGRHGATSKESAPVPLSAGRHDIVVEHFDGGGGRSLSLQWRAPGAAAFAPLPQGILLTENDPTRLTSPGIKSVLGQRRPGDRRPLAAVHPAYRLEAVRPEGFEPRVGALAVLSDGRLVVGTFDPLQRDEIRLPDIESKEPDRLHAISAPGSERSEVRVVVEGVHEPAGACVVGEDLYVSHRRAITRFRDLDGDGVFEDRHDVASGWEGWNYHQFTTCLVHHRGKLYAALTTTMAPPRWEGMGTNAGPCGPLRGGILEVDLTSETARVIAGGLRTPNGLGVGPDGSLLCADNQGTWLSTSQLVEIVDGRFYGHFNRTNLVPALIDRYPAGGHPSVYCDRLRAAPALWMPQNEVSNSPTEPLLLSSGPFAGQVLVGDVTAGGLRRVFLERVGGHLQGALFRFSQGLEGGVNRLKAGPDGSLYVGCIGAGGNWHWRGRQFGLQRLVPTGVVAFEMAAVRARHDGFEIEFTGALDPEWASEPAHYTLEQWRYEPTAEYGGPKVDVERLIVSAVEVSPDARRVHLRVTGLKSGRCVHLVTAPTSRDGEEMWSTEAWYTLVRRPAEHPPRPAHIGGLMIRAPAVGVGVAPPRDGVPLIGRGFRGAFRTADSSGLPREGRRSQDELLALPDGVAVDELTGDLTTAAEFGDFRLHVEWNSPPGGEGQRAGNSGVYLQGRYEIQVLGTLAGDRPLAADEAGSLYGIRPADVNASTGPGTWQAYDVWFRAPRFEAGAKTEDARVTVYWNGELVHDDVELAHPTGARSGGDEGPVGPLVLQLHGSDARGGVRYRNLWVAPLMMPALEAVDPARPWKDLVGEGLDGFESFGGTARFERRGDEIVGITVAGSPSTYLTTKRSYRDFDLRFEVKIDAELNSGVQIRSEPLDGARGLRGYQVEVDPSRRGYSGGIYDQGRRGWIAPLIDKPYARRAWRVGAWNRIEVSARGGLIRTWVNGVPAADLLDHRSREGRIGLQVHAVGDRARPLEVRYRKLRIRELQ